MKYWSGPNFGPDNKNIINIRTGLNIVQNWSSSEFDTVRNFVRISLMLKKNQTDPKYIEVIFEFSLLKSVPIIRPKRISSTVESGRSLDVKTDDLGKYESRRSRVD